MKARETNIMKQIVNEHVINQRKKKKERGNYFYASEAYLPHNPKESKCPRQLGYKILGYEPTEKNDDAYIIFALGDLYHEFIQDIFVKEKLATQVEEATIIYDEDGKHSYVKEEKNKTLIKQPVEIHGRLDLKFELLEESFLADIKTISANGWYYLKGKPKESHYAQVQVYLKDTGLKKGLLLYINKSTGEMKEFMLDYDEEYVTEYLNNYKKLHNQIMEEGLPDRPFRSGQKTPWQCRYCGFTSLCLNMTQDEVAKKKHMTYEDG